jgi:nucleoid-associated protein YgaU
VLIAQTSKEEHMTPQGQIPSPYSDYTTQAGDTLSGIAQRAYNDGSQPYWMAIYRMNQSTIGNDPNVISPGMLLWIPRFAASPQEDNFYIVQAGDTLSSIAQQVYNDGSQPYWRTIYLVNQYEIGDDPNVIHPGQPLYLPVISNPNPGVDAFYIVQAGDTLSSIAQQVYKDGNSWSYIRDDNMNVIRDDLTLKSGQILFIPFGPVQPGGGNIHIPVNPTWPKKSSSAG